MEKLKVLNRDAVKYIAIFCVFWGHMLGLLYELKNGTSDGFTESMSWWLDLISNMSLICPPIMFFMIGDGYKYSRDRKKYGVRLLIFGIVTQIALMIALGWVHYVNVGFTLLFGLIEISLWESKLKKWQKITLIALLIIFGVVIGCEWGFFGDLTILFLYIWRDKPKYRLIAFTSVMLLWQGLALFYNPIPGCIERFAAVMIAYAIMTIFYNGKKGHFPTFSKWFFYIFYPAHYLLGYAWYLAFMK